MDSNSQKIAIVIIILFIVFLILFLKCGCKSKINTCKNDNDCDGKVCNDGKCVTCVFDSDCSSQQKCSNNECIVTDNELVCTGCSLDENSIVFENDPNTDVSSYFWDGSVQSDGKIVVIGRDALSRYNIDGTRDLTFGTNGWYEIGDDISGISGSESLEIDSNDNIYVCATGLVSLNRMHVVKVLPDGGIDPAFGIGGIASFPIAETGVVVSESIIFDFEGNIYGVSRDGGFLFKLTSAGQIDNTFGTNGIVRIDWDGEDPDNIETWNIDIYNNQLYIALYDSGVNADRLGAVRYNLDGTKDITYANNGNAIFELTQYFRLCTGASLNCYGAGVGPDGCYYLSVTIAYNDDNLCGNYPIGVVKFGVDGTLDTSFGENGVFVDTATPFYTPDIFSESYHRITFLPCNGNLMLGVSSYQSGVTFDTPYVLQLTPDGTQILNSSYTASIQTIGELYAWCTFPHPDGYLVMIGELDLGNGVSAGVKLFECSDINYSRTNRPW
mgnify:CR=1 FL=1|tara:strand:+ start:1170 stop:2663 length:1494 start_codon:yes stop_codon:yes gene_type:complete